MSGDTDDGIDVALSWRLLVLHGSRRRRLTLPAAGSASAPRVAAQPLPAQLGPSPADTARTENRARRTRKPRRALHDRLLDLEHGVAVVRRLVERRALRVARLEGWLEFALRDVGETGRAYCFLCALATLLDPSGRFAVHPRWDVEDRLAADVELEVRVQPLRTLLVLLGARLRRRAPADATAASHSAGGSLAA